MPPRLAYALFMALALAVFLLARPLAPRPAAAAALPLWKRLALLLAAFAGGSLGAKLPFVLGAEDAPWSLAAWLGDGKTVLAALAGGYLAVELAKLALAVRVKTGDGFALPLAAALAVGRWGCYFNGCCHGTAAAIPWAVDFGDGVPRHPTQVYESLFHLAMAAILLAIARRPALAGALRFQQLKLYLIAYCAFRFFTERIRPEPAWALGLTFYQWGSIGLAAALAVQWVIDGRRGSDVLDAGADADRLAGDVRAGGG